MKKIAFLLLFFVAVQLNAQEIHFIPKIGLNLANMTNSNGSMKAGLNIGVAGEVMLTNHFAVEPGVFYSMQGTKGKEDGFSTKFKNDYLNIPILFKGYVYEGFNLFAGPQLGFKVSSKMKASKSGTSVSTSEGSELFKTFDFALVIGAGYQSPMGYLISLSYNIGLANTIDKDKVSAALGQSFDESSRNGVLQLNLGWRF